MHHRLSGVPDEGLQEERRAMLLCVSKAVFLHTLRCALWKHCWCLYITCVAMHSAACVETVPVKCPADSVSIHFCYQSQHSSDALVSTSGTFSTGMCDHSQVCHLSRLFNPATQANSAWPSLCGLAMATARKGNGKFCVTVAPVTRTAGILT